LRHRLFGATSEIYLLRCAPVIFAIAPQALDVTQATFQQMRARLSIVSTFSILAVLAAVAPARADDGAGWFWLEYRQPIYGRSPDLPRFQLRFLTDTRLSTRSDIVLHQQYLRVGLWMDAAPWLAISTNGTIYGDRFADGKFAVESRLESEVYFQPRIGQVQLVNRHRLEWRFREGADAKLRYRTFLRIEYAPAWLKYRPFVWSEFLIDTRDGFNENRLVAGVRLVLQNAVMLDLGYMLIHRRQSEAWVRDHVFLASFLIGVPPKKR